MSRITQDSTLKPLSARVESLVRQVEAVGGETCVLTWPEFEALGRSMDVVAENREIFRDLGVLGYVGQVTVFHSESWSAKPLKFRDFESRI
jgi:hypothetical protein